jgi:deazaflavin-dependent oxidoreductase (nitroreductase family)
MAIDGKYEPSPWQPIADQVQRYEETGGTEGSDLDGVPCVILWTRGRHTGTVRKTPLMRVNDGDRYAVVASLGGAPKHPVWYLNLVSDPLVSLQDGSALRDYAARVVEGDERAEWWKKANAVWPHYEEYQAKTDRTIPVVVLDPV